MKTCTLCKSKKEMSEFYKDKSKCDGLRSTCKECHNTSVKKRLENPETKRASAKYRTEWEAQNKYVRQEYKANWLALDMQKNPEKYAHRYALRYQNNKGKFIAKTRKRQAAKLQRTPKWLDVVDMFELDCIYTYAAALRNVGLKYDVDHIYPLQGKRVSGLHIPSNLQVIPESENRGKSNTFEVV